MKSKEIRIFGLLMCLGVLITIAPGIIRFILSLF